MSSLFFRHRFKLLLATLVALILLAPVILDGIARANGNGEFVFLGTSICLLLAATLAISGKRGALAFALCLVIPAILLQIAIALWRPAGFTIIHHVVRILFMGFVIEELVRHLFRPGLVTFDTLCASMCVYLLLGICWENVFVILETLHPGSFITVVRSISGSGALDGEAARSFRLLYFSFTTLTTLAFGDIVPGTNVARMCAVTEAIVGQGYLLIMVSRLVGMHVAQTMPPGQEPQPEK